MQNMKLNETPVRTSRNFNINNIKLENIEILNEIKEFKNVEIISKNSKVRIENNPNKYSENVMECVRQRFGLEKYDDSRDEEINQLSPDEVFDHVCNWNGLLGYATTIKTWIGDIYKVKFDNI